MQRPSKYALPCIVLGVETQIGLGLVRELGRAGVPVIGIAADPHALGLSSKYLFHKVVSTAPRSAALMRVIQDLGEHYGPCPLFTVSEANMIWLADNVGKFGKVRPIVPDSDKLDIVLDKQKTLAAASAVGIAVPQTHEPQTMQEALAIASHLKFPVVLKWKDPNSVSGQLASHGIEMHKAEYVYSYEQFLATARRYEPIEHWPMAQSYCAGVGLGQFFYMRGGQAVRRFQHLRVAEWPPEGGFSSVCDSIGLEKHQDLQEKSIALLRHIGWEGVAMVEYRWNAANGQAVLMEINGRFWGSYPLAVHCHAEFALISYLAAIGESWPLLPVPLEGLRCRMMSTEIKRLVRLFLQPWKITDSAYKIRRWQEVKRYVLDFFRPNVTYYVWDKDDPQPFWSDMRNALLKLIGKPAD